MTMQAKRLPSPASGPLPPESGHTRSDGDPPRRHWFYELAAGMLGMVIGVLPAVFGGITFLDPLTRRPRVPAGGEGNGSNSNAKEGFVRLAAINALEVGAAPQRYAVIADHLDSWNYTPRQPVGAVYLQRIGEREFRCFNATCPHAGCSVSCDGNGFVCPCHSSAFQLDGARRPAESGRDNPSPRNLDSLEVDGEMLQKGEVWIKFQNFYTGTHDKVPKQ